MYRFLSSGPATWPPNRRRHDRQRGWSRRPAAEAEAPLLPNLQMMARRRTGQLLGRSTWSRMRQRRRWRRRPGRSSRPPVTGQSSVRRREAADQIRSLADESDVDEADGQPVASAHRGTDPGPPQTASSPHELLAKELF